MLPYVMVYSSTLLILSGTAWMLTQTLADVTDTEVRPEDVTFPAGLKRRS